MILKQILSLPVVIVLFSASSPALETDGCIAKILSISVTNIKIGSDTVAYELTLTNNTTIDLGGAIIRQVLLAEGRPTALSESYSQHAHTLRGGLLAGETTTVTEYIGLRKREFQLAAAAPSLEITINLENVADIQSRAIGDGYDPFALWAEEKSEYDCVSLTN